MKYYILQSYEYTSVPFEQNEVIFVTIAVAEKWSIVIKWNYRYAWWSIIYICILWSHSVN